MSGKLQSIFNYFELSKTEQRGIIALLVLIILLIGLNFLIPYFLPPPKSDQSEFMQFVSQFEKEQQLYLDSIKIAKEKKEAFYISSIGQNPLFKFDPNQLTKNEWLMLGLSEYQVSMIEKYKNKGGFFETPDDFGKMYAMSSEEFEILKPYIDIQTTKVHIAKTPDQIELKPVKFDPNTVASSELLAMGISDRVVKTIINYREKGGFFKTADDLKKLYNFSDDLFKALYPFVSIEEHENLNMENKSSDLVVIDINTADTLDLQQLKGIGPSYAKRIVMYRHLLGGYYDVSQLLEVYGMDSTRFAGIKNHIEIKTKATKKININSASIKQLLKHPYIEFYVAKSIIKHREKHGTFVKLEELKNARLMYPELFNKITPYLTVSE